MAQIKLIRIDTRLIHGQICTEWIKFTGANRIVVADDDLAKDEFMSNIYLMAAPMGVKVNILSLAETAKKWQEDELGNGAILLILKNPENCYKLYKMGFTMKEVNIGNLIASSDKQSILKNVFLDQKEFKCLKEMNDDGVQIYVQNVPHHSKTDFSEVVTKFHVN